MAPLIRYLDSFLTRRQNDSPPEDTSDQSASSQNLSGGAIAGIVIGSIFGVLLLWWIFRSCGAGFGSGNQQPPPSAYYHHEKSPRGRSRSSQRHHRHHHHHSPRRSSSLRPVVVETKYQTVPRPAATYAYPTQAADGYHDGYAYKQRSSSNRRRVSGGY